MTKLLILANLLSLFLSTNYNKETDTNLAQKEVTSTASSVIKKEIKCDTNPILTLSFGDLIKLSINYLRNLEEMLKVISTNSHEKDRISNSVKEAILDLFTGNEVNTYELNEHIKTVLGENIDDIFNGQSSVPLTIFCDGLAFRIREKLIEPFQTTSIKELKKNFGKNFSKYKNSPYPSINLLIITIDLNDIPFDVQGQANQERLLKNLALWYSDFLKHLLKFEAEHQTDFLNNTLLQEKLKAFGSSMQEEVSPPSCKLHLADNIVNKLGATSIVKAIDLISLIKTELEALRVKIKASIEADNFEGSDNVNFFLGIRPESYFSYISIALEENRFEEYKKTIKDWVISVDTSISALKFNEERTKYKYKSKLIALNLSKLFRVEHGLIDFSSFINPIIKELKASDSSMELSEIEDLFATAIADINRSIYANLANLYHAEMEKGSLGDSLDSLEIALPRMAQIQRAILNAKN
jgi:hypothetical protein